MWTHNLKGSIRAELKKTFEIHDSFESFVHTFKQDVSVAAVERAEFCFVHPCVRNRSTFLDVDCVPNTKIVEK